MGNDLVWNVFRLPGFAECVSPGRQVGKKQTHRSVQPFGGQSSRRIVPLARVTICMIETFICIINIIFFIRSSARLSNVCFYFYCACSWGPGPVLLGDVVHVKAFQKNTQPHHKRSGRKVGEPRGLFLPKERWGWGRNCTHIRINPSVFSSCLSTSSISIRVGFYCLKCLWFRESVLPKARLLLKYVLLYIHSPISPSPI